MVYLLLSFAAIFCAYQVVRAQRLLLCTLWLSATSALAAVILYTLGAVEVAVMELSVGAGLVTVLFVFAFSIIGEVTFDPLTIIPRPFAWVMILAVSAILGWFVYPFGGSLKAVTGEPSFAVMLWEQRGLDVLVQIVLIFAGVLGLLGLLSESYTRQNGAHSAVELPIAFPVENPASDSARIPLALEHMQGGNGSMDTPRSEASG
jgi:uncharacterized MnhB-related membrane protein